MMRSSLARRVALAVLAVLVLTSSTSFAEPIDDAQNTLVSVSNVQATGVGPTTVMVIWHNDSVWPSVVFRIETSKSDLGPWQNAFSDGGVVTTSVCSTSNICMQPVGKLGPPADPAPRWFRVVPIMTSPAPPQPNGNLTGVQPGDPRNQPQILEGKPSAPDPALLGPLAPTNVLCNGGTNDSLACVNTPNPTLTWDDNSDEQKFVVVRVKSPTPPTAFPGNGTVLNADTRSYSDGALDYNSTYWYRVIALRQRDIANTDGSTVYREQSFSNCVTTGDPTDDDPKHYCALRLETPPVPAPSDPSGLTVQFIAPNSAKLTWIDQAPPSTTYIDEDGWFIELASQPGQWSSQLTRPALTGEGTVTYTDTNIPTDTLRCYRVRGWRLGPAFSQYTPRPDDPNGNGVCIGTTPRAPSGLTATALSNAAVLLNWKDNSSSETSYVIERCTGACTSTGTFSQVGEVPTDVTTFTDTSTSGQTTYTYRVIAVNPSGRSAPSNLASATTLQAPIAAPSQLNAAGLQHAIRLTWTDNSTTETGFEVEYREPDTTDWQLLTNDIGPNVTTYLDRNLAAFQSRCYRVRAVKADPQISDPSNEACAKTLGPAAPDGAPTSITAVPQSNTQIAVSWNDNATNEDGYALEYAVFPDKLCADVANQGSASLPFNPMTTIRSADPTSTIRINYAATNLIPHTAYFFRVKAYNQDGESTYSPVSACAQTYGPAKPVYADPTADSHTDPTRCNFTMSAPTSTAAGDDRVGGLLVYLNAYVPSTGVATTDTLYVIGPGGTVPGSQNAPNDGKHFVVTSGHGLSMSGDNWQISYDFKHSVKYTIHTVAYTYDTVNGVHYGSAGAVLSDLTVLADCPTSQLPGS